MQTAPVPNLEVYVDVAASGRVMAHVLEPPGLGVRFRSYEEMRHRLAGELTEHMEWLRSHGEPVPDAITPSYRVVEEVHIAGNFESGDDVGFYAPDIVPVSRDEVERYLRIAGHAHGDLLRLVDSLDNETLDWVRDAGTRPIR